MTKAAVTSLRSILEGITGVWEGYYAHFNVDGTLIEKYSSHQETRLEGNNWYERIVYQRLGKSDETIDFKAILIGESLIFEDAKFLGTTIVVSPQLLVFPYTWKDRPNLEILEVIYFVDPNYRTRHWQHLDNKRLFKTTLIEEKKILDATVAIWN